jgi:hypothetical protein
LNFIFGKAIEQHCHDKKRGRTEETGPSTLPAGKEPSDWSPLVAAGDRAQ